MRRRDVVMLLGATAFAGSRATLAQMPSKVYRVGTLWSGAPFTDKSPLGAALIRELSERGYRIGQNLFLEARGAERHADRFPQLIAELAASEVDVIVTGGYPAARAAKEGTTIPVVSINSGDPVGTRLVSSLAHPGGNLTGISDVSAELAPKRLQLLNEISRGLRRVAVLWNADDLGMTCGTRRLRPAPRR
jgi:putative ABC transport system substrate-binding protein